MWKYSTIGKVVCGVSSTISLIALGAMVGQANSYWRWVFGLSHLAYFTLILTLWLTVYLKRLHTNHNIQLSTDQINNQKAARFFIEIIMLLGRVNHRTS